jgi:hypothetical protein
MMQFHYTVAYDSVEKRWFVEQDPNSFYPDGNVWDEKQCDDIGNGWLVPEYDSPEEALDYELLNTLGYIVSTFPIPKEA